LYALPLNVNSWIAGSLDRLLPGSGFCTTDQQR
jgi:hypothetical protein